MLAKRQLKIIVARHRDIAIRNIPVYRDEFVDKTRQHAHQHHH